jgi:ubiquinone/menaquinone biosynthesis C-methylase UbiE
MRKLRELLTHWVYKEFNNESDRNAWVKVQLSNLPPGWKILDAGAGTQQYRKYCDHLDYVSQDFDAFSVDKKSSMATSMTPYTYGSTDIVSDILSIPMPESSFDYILCTEVLEHVPKPVETIRELSRILKPGGILILTFPMNCLRHFDPYFFTSGLSDNWVNSILPEFGLTVKTLSPVGDYFSWMKVEIFRTIFSHRLNPLVWILLLPSLVFFSTKKKTEVSISTLCMGYHVIAQKSS